MAHPGLRRVSPEVEGIFEGNFRRFDLFGFLGLKEGLDEQARLDPFFGVFFGLGEVFAVLGVREVEGVVADRRVVVGGQLAVGVAVVVATVGNFPLATADFRVVPVFKLGPELLRH